MTPYAVSLRFNNTPFLIIGGVIGAFLFLTVAARVIESLRDARERKTFRASPAIPASFDAAQRMEAMKLMERIGAVRARMLELDRALTQRKEGVRWRFGIGTGADKDFRDAAADSEIDRFLSDATERDLNAAQGEMISLFREAANWLEKYAPEEVPPLSLRERARIFFSRFFPALKRVDALKEMAVVRKTEEKRLPGESEPPEKVANDEPPEPQPKSPEKLRIPLDLLEAGKPGNVPDAASLRQEAKRLADALQTYKIDAAPSGMPVAGPSVTRYEFKLQPGVKLNKLMNLADDIALSLGVAAVRIAPVPGKSSVVGIEAQNSKASAVVLRDVLESRDFLHSLPSVFALGRGIDGEIVTADLEALPHVLIAGTTGSGKSVCLNSLIVSLLYKVTPSELRLLMIDPKQVELTPYNGIPHLTQPVVTGSAQAVTALQQAAAGMETRYETFKTCGVKELSDYNRKAKSPLPRIVIVIDELADLMMKSGNEIEDSVVRIAQMGRAAGIHLVIATQSPRTDVITGLMKANIPSRIAFAVASALESRIILDTNGAEKLIGNGDMLFRLQTDKARRVQGCYVSPEEIEKVVAFLKK